MRKLFTLVITLLAVGVFSQGFAAKPAETNRYRFENAQLRVTLAARTPDQIAAFYEGRKFPSNMIQRLREACFITVGIKNKSKQILWLELDNWSFKSGNKTVKRYHRNEWPPLWEQMAVPMASQSTFRWTLLPEELDFRPEEREGGNIILDRVDSTFTVTAHFRAEGQPASSAIPVKLENVRCAK